MKKRKDKHTVNEVNATAENSYEKAASVMSAYPINSMFDGAYCKYNYPYDDSYIRWLLYDAQTVVSPVLEIETGIPLPKILIKDAEELVADNTVPKDYIEDSMFMGDAEEEIEVL